MDKPGMKPALCFILLMTLTSGHPGYASVRLQEIAVNAPFAMAGIQVPDFSDCPKFPITEFGAEPGSKEKTSSAIEQAVDESNKAGGGTVIIPAGEWITEKVHLKRNEK
ncbi:hypothetical protein JW948_16030 [bacterium]|nr:hypothetical protein [bacterium]